MTFVPIDKVKKGMVLADDIYVFFSVHVLLLKKGEVITEQFLKRLHLFDVPGIYIDDGVSSAITPGKPLIDKKLKREAVGSIQNVFQSIQERNNEGNKESIGTLSSIVLQMVDSLMTDSRIVVNIGDLKSYDDYTYHHSISVCMLSIATGVGLGLSKSELHRLGLSSVLHDIGKVQVPIELISKPSRLTKEEFAIVQKHAQLGGEYIIDHNLGTNELYNAITSHHERVDGTGYPRGLKGTAIPLHGKIISVADVYDALTSQRPYRQPMPFSDAAEYVMGNCGTFFDYDVVKGFLKKLEIYPVGSFVELSNGKIALVVNNENQLRPIVRMVEPPNETVDLCDKSMLNVVITRTFQDLRMDQPF